MADLSKDVLLFSKEQRRMCETFESNNCIGCELYGEPCLIGGYRIGKDNDEHILDVVQKWHDTHPQKTYLMDFWRSFQIVIKTKKDSRCRAEDIFTL